MASAPAKMLPGPQPRTATVNSGTADREIGLWGGAANNVLRKTLATLPDAATYAGDLVLTPAGDALKRAMQGHAGWQAASEPDAVLLRPWGLCEARGLGLTVFGCDVRLAMVG